MKSSGEKKIAMFFEQIKKDIFPEWDKKDEWRVKNLKNFKDDSKHINSDYLGKCDSTGKNNLSQLGSRGLENRNDNGS